jgi:uncharacterized membrane protein (GlpM family)
MDYVIRFVLGGLVVSLFATLGDILKPKSFAGLFGASPSVAFATLALTVISHNRSVASIESRSMIVGAVALLLYANACVFLMGKLHWKASLVTLAALPLWGLVVWGLRLWLLR